MSNMANAERNQDGGWILSIVGRNEKITITRLIVATGLASDPAKPKFEGMEGFQAPLFHSRDFLKNADVLEKAQRVCITGGGKSPFDVAYAFANTGTTVDWVIRESSHGRVYSKYCGKFLSNWLLTKISVTSICNAVQFMSRKDNL